MKKLAVLLLSLQLSFVMGAQIIADHTVVDQYDQIPDEYIQKVKTMLVEMAGESHSSTFNYGSNLLERYDSRFQSQYFGGTPPEESSSFLRIGKIENLGEQTYFTNEAAISSYKSRIANQNNTGNTFDVMAFVWCWDMYYDPVPGGGEDLVYGVRWGGTTEESPDGVKRWGLDAGDAVLTGNSICMDTYLNAVVEYQQYCIDNNWDTKIIFTTGPVDDTYPNSEGTEDGVQREIKHDYIRDFVNKDPQRILFDYADILCWNNEGEKYEGVWNDGGTLRAHAHMHPDNQLDYDDNWNIIPGVEDGDHIGEVGSLRIMKAMWWMLARIAGWDGLATNTNQRNTSQDVLINVSEDQIIINVGETSDFNNLLVYDTAGVLIHHKVVESNRLYLSTAGMHSGIYLISLLGANRKEILKVVVQ